MTNDFNLDGPVYQSGVVTAWCSHGNPIGACMACNIEEVEKLSLPPSLDPLTAATVLTTQEYGYRPHFTQQGGTM